MQIILSLTLSILTPQIFRRTILHMRKIASGLAAVVATLLLAGCTWSGTGTVSSKYYSPPSTIPVLVGKVIVQSPVAECNGLRIAPDNEPDKLKDVCINREAWDRIEPGQPINITK